MHARRKTHTILVGIGLIGGWLPTISRASGPDFERDIAPILTRHCVRCHQGEEPQGGVDLTTLANALGQTESMSVLEPGDAPSSLLYEVVSGDKPRMPKSGSPLTDADRTLLTAWIDAGAVWPETLVLRDDPADWWSLRPLVRPEVPMQSDRKNLSQNPIDAFVAQKWRELGLHGSPEADRRTLIRRVTFDLIGLPPSFEEVDTFASDPDPDAYERLVDRLLDSPRYGERWARHWLDVVHYGDTHGYDKDKLRPNAWPYRDYVIRAFNEDKPYAQFVREQIAGDHFYPGHRDGYEGLGMIAAGPFDYVGQMKVGDGTLEKARVRNIDRDDMVSTVINTFVSATAQCARCHDHKFDPISQKDYYQLQAVFAAVDRADRAYDADPSVAADRALFTSQRLETLEKMSAIEKQIEVLGGDELRRIDAALASLRGSQAGNRPAEYGYHSAIAASPETEKWVQIDLGEPVALTQIELDAADDDFAGIGPGFGFPRRFKIEVAMDPLFDQAVHIVTSHESEDYANPKQSKIRFDAHGISARYIRMTATRLATRDQDYIFALAELRAFDDAGRNVAMGRSVQALDSIEAPVRWQASNLVDGRTPIRSDADSQITLEQWQSQREALVVRVAGPKLMESLEKERSRLHEVESSLASLPPQDVVYAAATDFPGEGSFKPTMGQPRTIHVLDRGAESAPQQPVEPAALKCVPGLSGDLTIDVAGPESLRRAALADWIVDRRNGLTWRSIVNRVWYYHFGRGLVESLNDFGRMGATPTHPELLDYLAVEFRDGSQSIKDLHRRIVTSSVYRQSSQVALENAHLDSGNQYLWRMNRRRLEAEAIRDSVLQASGALKMDMGGPGFLMFGLVQDHSPHYLYDQYDPNDPATHRRSIYRFVVRSVPDPWMNTLDCADASLLTDRRNETLTPLQALAMLNNPFMIRMAERMADRVRSLASGCEDEVRTAVQLTFQRAPTSDEVSVLAELWNSEGLVQVCRALLNSNEFVFVD